ncbi:ABC transporter ATP-binding protein [Streptomyces carpaticus]|uniref:dipeptide ABC transporter ATP-binding protein n=1 Tax=Streptomyces carpaticus TaxID=285558 RepID=UPI00220D0141|nr:ABC transporter ATP-binding protein [Streptomyces carpaticus]
MTTDAPQPLLSVRDLHVAFRSRRSTVRAVRGVNLDLAPGRTLALVGESGSGKSTTGLAVLGLLPPGAQVTGGHVTLAGRELTALRERAWRTVRGREIAFVPQDPMVSLNPVRRVGHQVAEVLLIHGLAEDRKAAHARAVDLLADAGLPEPAEVARTLPHELSGGMCQRVLIAIALAGRPKLLIADEPTSALDVTVQRRILDHLETVTEQHGTALLLITHDLAVAADRADEIAVMSRGEIVERGPGHRVLTAPAHPYTRELVAAVPDMTAAPAAPAPAGPPLLEVRGLRRSFDGGRTAAVDGVGFTLAAGGSLGIVGESGSGKSTTAQLVLRLDRPDAGTITFDGHDLGSLGPAALRRLRRDIQPVFQDPYGSLDPRFTVAQSIAEPLRAYRTTGRRGRQRRVAELLDLVRLPATAAGRRPAELSGGQRQRVSIARALALTPRLLVLDEPVSALDVSVQASVLDLLAELRAGFGLSYLFISHDLAVVRQVCDRVAVMRRGRIVETGPVARVFDHPGHPYTQELLSAIPGRRARTPQPG